MSRLQINVFSPALFAPIFIGMEHSDPSSASFIGKTAIFGFGLLFLAALILWAGFGSLIFIDLASVIRSCF